MEKLSDLEFTNSRNSPSSLISIGSLTRLSGTTPTSLLTRATSRQAIVACRAEAPPGAKAGPQADKFAGGHRSRVTPVPIPNTEVKPATADGTAWETVWESRSLPALSQGPRASVRGLSFVRGQRDRRTQFPMRCMGAYFLGRLACSAAVWESRSLPALSQSPRASVRGLSFVRQRGAVHVSHRCMGADSEPPRMLGGGVGDVRRR